jgi:hypothetical protein
MTGKGIRPFLLCIFMTFPKFADYFSSFDIPKMKRARSNAREPQPAYPDTEIHYYLLKKYKTIIWHFSTSSLQHQPE